MARYARDLGIALDSSVQTPLFYSIVNQMDQLYLLIGDRSSGMCDILAKICEYQAANK
jgi:hypothetical protein